MGKYPITQAQYQKIMDNNPSNFKGDDRPVECVSWDDAVEFCKKLSKHTGKEYRLPTEAEWEYACRSVISNQSSVNSKEWNEKYHQPFHFGQTITKDLANYGGNVGETTAVGKYQPNNFGLYDMHGNVWEWCQDDWHDNYENAPNDRKAWTSGDSSKKVVRGGSWFNDPNGCRSAVRDHNTRDLRSSAVGFRVVCVAPRTT